MRCQRPFVPALIARIYIDMADYLPIQRSIGLSKCRSSFSLPWAYEEQQKEMLYRKLAYRVHVAAWMMQCGGVVCGDGKKDTEWTPTMQRNLTLPHLTSQPQTVHNHKFFTNTLATQTEA